MRTSFLVPLVLLTGCAGAMFQTQSLTTTTAPADAYTCVRQQLAALQYRERAHDDTDYRVVAERIDETVRRPDTQFRRLIDRVIVEIAPNAQGTTTAKVEAHTVAEYSTQRGQTFEEEKVRDRVKIDAQALEQNCLQQ